MVSYPPFADVKLHAEAVAGALRAAGVPSSVTASIRTKALRTARKQGGQHATNRRLRWQEDPLHPQFATELDSNIVLVKLSAQIFCFDNAPTFPTSLTRVRKEAKAIASSLKSTLEEKYLGHRIEPGTFRDSLLLEHFSFDELVAEGLSPVAGHSGFHIGHEDPTLKPKHQPQNIAWRSFRSNLIQGNMTLPQARLYFVRMIARYFELGELEVVGQESVAPDVTLDELSDDGTG